MMNIQLNFDTGMLINILDIMFDENDRKAHPEFILMMNNLSLKITRNLQLNKSDKEFNKVQTNLTTARYKYLRNAILYKVIEGILYAKSLKRHEDATENESILDNTLQRNLHEILNFARMKQSLDCLQIDVLGDLSCKSSLLGIDLQQLAKPQWAQDNIVRMKKMILQSFNKDAIDLSTFCRELFDLGQIDAKAVDAHTSPTNEAVIACEEIKYKVEELNGKKTCLQRARAELQFLMRRCKDELESVHDDLGWLGQLQLNKKDDLLKIELLQSRSQLLLNKQRHLQLEVLQEIYSQETIADHKNINLKMDDHIHDLHCQIIKAKHQLDTYTALGPEFEPLIERHAALLNTLEIRRRVLDNWNIAESH